MQPTASVQVEWLYCMQCAGDHNGEWRIAQGTKVGSVGLVASARNAVLDASFRRTQAPRQRVRAVMLGASRGGLLVRCGRLFMAGPLAHSFNTRLGTPVSCRRLVFGGGRQNMLLLIPAACGFLAITMWLSRRGIGNEDHNPLETTEAEWIGEKQRTALDDSGFSRWTFSNSFFRRSSKAFSSLP